MYILCLQLPNNSPKSEHRTFSQKVRTKFDRESFNSHRERCHPLALIMGLDCGPWNALNSRVNFIGREEELEAWRDEQRPMIKWACSLCNTQMDDGDVFLFEQPWESFKDPLGGL